MAKVIDSFEPGFMLDGASPKTERKRQLFAQMAPDLQQMLLDGMPEAMVERLARSDLDAA